MKKLIFPLFLFLSFSSLVHAQWTTSGTVTSTTNAIGIGTTTPNEKFVVNGNIRSILDPTYNPTKNVVTIKQLGFSGSSGAMNWALRGVYQYTTGALSNADGGDLDIIKSLDGNTVLGTKTDGTALGNVGIGTTTPKTKLDVNGGISMGGIGYFSSSRIPANDYANLFLGGSIKDNGDGTYTVQGDGASNYFSAIRMYNGTNNGNAGAINFYSGPSVGGNPYTINNTTLFNNYLQMRIAGGNVSIGTADSKGYKLAVNGSMIATSVVVKSAGNWPDYVFKKDYQLPSLQEVKVYIDQHQHLPEIPSEQQIAKDGLNLGEMNKLLMKKVEELTLYLIVKDKQAQKQQDEIELLKAQMETLLKP